MTVTSMTGFGEAVVQVAEVELRIQLKSVNHRYLDVSWKLPQLYGGWERELQQILRDRVRRGHLDVLVLRKTLSDATFEVEFSEGLYRKYLESLKKGLRVAKIKGEESFAEAATQILLRREVLEIGPPQALLEYEKELLQTGFREAVSKLEEMRREEGAALGRELNRLHALFNTVVSDIEVLAPKVPDQAKRRLEQRIEKLKPGVEIDAERLAQEVAIIADRSDITEELSRLRSHLAQFEKNMKHSEEVGRKLEFLLQEMARELNTIAAKAQGTEIVHQAIEGKTLVEKIREQVLNVE